MVARPCDVALSWRHAVKHSPRALLCAAMLGLSSGVVMAQSAGGGATAAGPTTAISAGGTLESVFIPSRNAQVPGGGFTLRFEPGSTAITLESMAGLAPLSGCLRGSAWDLSAPAAPDPANPQAVPSARTRVHLQTKLDKPELTESSQELVNFLATCAGARPSYVVLLPDLDGQVGRVVVRGTRGERELSRRYEMVPLDGSAAPVVLDQNQINQTFDPAILALPKRPEHFVIHFGNGVADPVGLEREMVAKAAASVRSRQIAEVSVDGHADTVGSAASNEALSRGRAEAVARQLRDAGVPASWISVTA